VQSVMSLSVGLLLVASLATMAMVSNPAFAGTGFKNKAECMEYVIDGTKVVRNHALQSAKVSKELAEKLCAEYWFNIDIGMGLEEISQLEYKKRRTASRK
jgi:hypothetical protein